MSLAQGMLPSSSRSIEAPNCQWLKRLPNLSNLKHLMKLDLSRCPKLREIEGLEGLESVETIKLVFCDSLRSFADEMLPSSLRSLEVHNCISLERLPSLSNLKLLRKLDLSHCLKLNEIEGLEGLESVEAIILYGCQNLRSFAEQMLPSTLVYLNVDHCQSLERLPNLSNLKHLKALNLSNCLKLNEIEGLQGLESIETITFNGADHLRSSINKKMYQAGNRHICTINSIETNIGMSLCSSSSPPSACSTSASPTPFVQGRLDPMVILNPGFSSYSPSPAYEIVADSYKSHQLNHKYNPYHPQQQDAIGSSEASHHEMIRSRFFTRNLQVRRSTMRAPRMRWTRTLHALFVHAIELLGGHERATAISIFKLMNVRDLTLAHVKSHLQMFVTVQSTQNRAGSSVAPN